MARNSNDDAVNRRGAFRVVGAFAAEACVANISRDEGQALSFDGGLVPDWGEFSAAAERRLSESWSDGLVPDGVRLGATVVGRGRKNRVLGTTSTHEAPGPPLHRRPHAPLPCGLYVGLCGALQERWPEIESAICTNWEINPSRDSSDWLYQRALYDELGKWHLGGYEDCPGLVWAVPFWILRADARLKPYLRTPPLKAHMLAPGAPLFLGMPGRGFSAFDFSPDALRTFKFQAPSPQSGHAEPEFSPPRSHPIR